MSTSSKGNLKRTWVVTILFVVALALYFLLPLLPTIPESIKHLSLTLTAVMAVHLLDRLWLFRDYFEYMVEIKKGVELEIRNQTSPLLQRIDEMKRGLGIKVSYLERQHNSANLFSRAREIVNMAEESILVLNSPTYESEEDDDTGEAAKERAQYYESILNRVRTGSGKIRYERLLQIHNEQDLKSIAIRKEYNKHLNRMLDEQHKSPNLHIHLLKVQARRLATFVLIDNKYLIWESNEFVDAQKIRMHGVFIIEDPSREITRHFYTFFDDLRLLNKGPVTRDDLSK